jgi:hypothetical protein
VGSSELSKGESYRETIDANSWNYLDDGLRSIRVCATTCRTTRWAGRYDAKGSAALEGRLLTTVLNGADDSPVTNIRIAIKNISPNFYTYVTGWATFYDSGAVRCGEGLFKLDALAPNESAETDTPGLRLRCTPASWRIVATNLLTRTYDAAKPTEAPPPTETPAVEKTAPVNFIISIDGERHPIQVDRPIVLKLGNRNRKIVLRPVP